MSKKMLIDATHAEETRVAIVDEDSRLADFDYESIVRKQMKGSIYLAKVTRVEPSLQAAFVNFGGNRHGFLPFSEIHPDYFRIPVADRDAFIAAQQAELEQHDHDDDEEIDDLEAGDATDSDDIDDEDDDDDEVVEVGGEDKPANDDIEESEDDADGNIIDIDEESIDESADLQDNADQESESSEEDDLNASHKNNRGRHNRRGGRGRHNNNRRGGKRYAANSRKVEMVGGDGVENDRPFRFNLRRQYKIQEVIKRGQIMLIQVSKEERGNKGAAVSAYLSLPGRYCVLMPNSPRAGGVSRKIANYNDRKRMKDVLDDLNVPEGMSVILRTAGVQRTKAEIKRDLDYLLRLWNNIRELTLKSSAPAVVYEEGNLIKRAIRDLYTRDIEEIYVSGDQGYKEARDFMKMLIPSHVKRVKEYKDDRIPLFHKHKVEPQIAEIGEPSVTLKSGGYLVLNPTEALVSVDVNSGKATKERHIEETALKTNLEAAQEVARQLRLRDLGGLVVIDFIDMEDRRNNRKVENRLREALSSDRARIQIGRISSFGLLELSRQRLNPSLTEAMFKQCDHCAGVGNVRTDDAVAIMAMRALEEEGIKDRASEVSLNIPANIAIYILNNKRKMLAGIEDRYGFKVHISTNEDLVPAGFEISVLRKKSDDEADSDEDQIEQEAVEVKDEDQQGNHNRKRGRRNNRGRRGGRQNNRQNPRPESDDSQDEGYPVDSMKAEKGDDQSDQPQRSEKKPSFPAKAKQHATPEKEDVKPEEKAKTPDVAKAAPEEVSDKPKRVRKKAPAKNKEDDAKEKLVAKKDIPPLDQVVSQASNDQEPLRATPKEYESVNEPPKQKKKGWWNKIID